MTIKNFSSMENCQVVLDLFPIFFLGKYVQYTPVRCYGSLTAKMIPFGIWSCTCTPHSLTADPLVCSWSSLLDHYCPFDLQPVKQDQMHSSLNIPLQRLYPID